MLTYREQVRLLCLKRWRYWMSDYSSVHGEVLREHYTRMFARLSR